MSGLKAIGMVFGGLMFLLMMFVGAGTAYYKERARQEAVQRDIPEASAEEYSRGYRGNRAEIDREIEREAEGVHIDTDSARPMVDVDPANR
jgi:hypothetical protein